MHTLKGNKRGMDTSKHRLASMTIYRIGHGWGLSRSSNNSLFFIYTTTTLMFLIMSKYAILVQVLDIQTEMWLKAISMTKIEATKTCES